MIEIHAKSRQESAKIHADYAMKAASLGFPDAAKALQRLSHLYYSEARRLMGVE